MKKVTASVSLLLFAGLVAPQESTLAAQETATPDALKTEIEAMKAPKVAW
jgi:hypothetical protein